MSHRASIRRQVKAILDGTVVPEGRAFTSRAITIGVNVMPCALIFIQEETRAKSDPDNDGRVLRTVKLIVEGALANLPAQELEDRADDMLTAIETAFKLNPTLGDSVERVRWRGSLVDVAPNAGTLIAACRVEYDIEVWTDNADYGDRIAYPDDADFVRPSAVETEPRPVPPSLVRPGHAPLPFGHEFPPFGAGSPQIYRPGPTPTDVFDGEAE